MCILTDPDCKLNDGLVGLISLKILFCAGEVLLIGDVEEPCVDTLELPPPDAVAPVVIPQFNSLTTTELNLKTVSPAKIKSLVPLLLSLRKGSLVSDQKKLEGYKVELKLVKEGMSKKYNIFQYKAKIK